MYVELESVNNPDFRYDNRKIKKNIVVIKNLKEAKNVCENFIETNNLGGGNWSGGKVFDDQDKQIAYVSYNGRIWQPGNYPQPEIILE